MGLEAFALQLPKEGTPSMNRSDQQFLRNSLPQLPSVSSIISYLICFTRDLMLLNQNAFSRI